MLLPFSLSLPALRLLPLALAAAVLAAGNPARADVLDQSFLGPGTQASVDVNTSFARAQTFTVGATGTLSRIELILASSNTTVSDEMTIDLRPTDESGVPLPDAASALATRTIAGDVLGGTLDENAPYELDFSSFAIPVTAGQQLAIVARSNVPFAAGRQFAWAARLVAGEGYAGGAAWIGTPAWALQSGGDGGVDLEFETYVEVPEPAGAALSAFMALIALAHRNRRV